MLDPHFGDSPLIAEISMILFQSVLEKLQFIATVATSCYDRSLSQTAFIWSKLNNEHTRALCKICSKLTSDTPLWLHWHGFVVFIVNFEQILYIALVLPLLIFEHVNTDLSRGFFVMEDFSSNSTQTAKIHLLSLAYILWNISLKTNISSISFFWTSLIRQMRMDLDFFVFCLF